MKRDWKMAGKLLLAHFTRIGVLLFGLYAICVLPTQIPWQVTFGLYAVGVVATHVWLFKGFAGNHRLTDYDAYVQDSGIFHVVFLWPAFLFFTFGPEITEGIVRKSLGLPNERQNEE